MPLPVLIWLPNVFFVIVAVLIVFLTLYGIMEPPRSRAEAIIEAHKVIIVGGISLAAVAVVEVIAIAPKLTAHNLSLVLIGATVLVGDAFFGLGLFAAALVRDEKIRTSKGIDRGTFWQVVCGLLVFVVAACVIVQFKFIDYNISQLAAASGH